MRWSWMRCSGQRWGPTRRWGTSAPTMPGRLSSSCDSSVGWRTTCRARRRKVRRIMLSVWERRWKHWELMEFERNLPVLVLLTDHITNTVFDTYFKSSNDGFIHKTWKNHYLQESQTMAIRRPIALNLKTNAIVTSKYKAEIFLRTWCLHLSPPYNKNICECFKTIPLFEK